jgi:RNA-directed DNA polymerase
MSSCPALQDMTRTTASSPANDPLLGRINAYLMRWLRNKYGRLRQRKKAKKAWEQAVALRPRFFAHWQWIPSVPSVW